MSEQTKSEYYMARAAAERALSDLTHDPRAAAIHAELAARYEEMALEFDTNPRKRNATG